MKEVDRERKRLKIHYKGFSDQFDEWKPYDDNKNFPVVRLNISSNHLRYLLRIVYISSKTNGHLLDYFVRERR